MAIFRQLNIPDIDKIYYLSPSVDWGNLMANQRFQVLHSPRTDWCQVVVTSGITWKYRQQYVLK